MDTSEIYEEGYSHGYAAGYADSAQITADRMEEIRRLRVFTAKVRQYVTDCEAFGDELEMDVIKAALTEVIA